MLKYGGVEYRSLEEQVRKNMEDISELDAGLTALAQKGGGTAVEIGTTLPDTATNGAITAEELSKLQESDSNYIIFKKEIYLLMDKQRNEGYITYSHVGVNGAMANVVKTITITLSTMTWVMIETPITAESGGESASVGNWIKYTQPIDMTYSAFNGKPGYYTIEIMVGNRISGAKITDGMEDVLIYTQNGNANPQSIQDMAFFYLMMPFYVSSDDPSYPASFTGNCNNKPVIIQGTSLTGVTSADSNQVYVSSITLTDESEGSAGNTVYYRINFDGGI